MQGLLIVDKPKDWTSHDVVAKIRNTLKVKKAGHGGTLDPTATGLLIVLLGDYTKRAESFLGLDKSYRITMEFGRSTTTGDEVGEAITQLPMDNDQLGRITPGVVEEALSRLTGTIPQLVPWFSAIKIGGKKLYEYARGKTPEELRRLDQEIARPVRDIEIYAATLVDFTYGTDVKYPSAMIDISCSSGTYTRVFVEDLGKVLGAPTYQTSLRRTSIGEYTLDNSVAVEQLGNAEYLQNAVQR